ncbi:MULTISPECIES: beta family protein [Pantoea]|uniref:beta family protein n=1 Tax=Pantoea TaxID=53335 RepID=UPI000DA6993F|nr:MULTISPECIES: hypothetical protein [Pantoea]MDF7786065.1 hypothetical protein [Pantoea stewartii]PZD63552.1 hypothetical protein ARC272_11795 [Pantoea ananatis]
MQSKYSEYPPYMPVIKWQKWEKKALENVHSSIIPRIAPCIEIRTSQQHADIITSLMSVWAHECYVDYSDPDGKLFKINNGSLLDTRLKEFFYFINQYYNLKKIIPTLSPQDFSKLSIKNLKDLQKCINIAFRLRLEALVIGANHISVITNALTFAHNHGFNVELIVDLRVTPTQFNQKALNLFSQQLDSISKIGFKSVRLLSGAFPDSIATIKTGSGNFIRNDWLLWQNISNLISNAKIGYADYGVLAPTWTEKVLTRRGSKVALKYTRDKDWLVLRAGGNKSSDSIALSQIFMVNHKADFKGKGYSYGDNLIYDRANPAVLLKNKKCGHYQFTEAWSHHMAFVVKEQY